MIEDLAINRLAASGVNRVVAPLMKAIHKSGAKKVSILAWDSEERIQMTGDIFAASFSWQLGRKCAIVRSEGLRVHIEEHSGFCSVALPEFVVPEDSMNEPLEDLMTELQERFPLIFIAGSPLREIWDSVEPKASSGFASNVQRKLSMTLSADAFVLMLPKGGIGREQSKKIEVLSRKLKLRWLGAVLMDDGESDA